MMLIGEVARKTGLSTSAIRYYERRRLLPSPERRNGRRYYTPDVLFQLEVIRFARASGFTLAEIRGLFAGSPYSANLRRQVRAKISELDRAIERARTMQSLLRTALRCRCLSLEECGRRLSRRHSTDRRPVSKVTR